MEIKKATSINSVCTAILQNSKIKKIDIYSIFRTIANKKSKIVIYENDYDTEAVISGGDLKDFISNVNPFFSYEDTEKIEYYKKYYNISKQIYDRCIFLIENSKKISYYRIKDVKAGHFLTFSELHDDTVSSMRLLAQYEDPDIAYKVVNKYLKLYRFLQIPKTLEVIGYNNQNNILEQKLFQTIDAEELL
jgi:hypothetical protein